MIENINFSSPTAKIVELSLSPGDLAGKIRPNKGGEIGSRFLAVLQMIVILIAVPIILTLGLLETAFLAITCRGEKAKTIFQFTMEMVTFEIGMLPMCFTRAILPNSWQEAIGDPYMSGLQKVAELWECNCCKSNGN